MSSIEVILVKSVSLGSVGQRVKVKRGYALNYLVPNGVALLCTPKNIDYYKQQEDKLIQQDKDTKQLANEYKQNIEKSDLIIVRSTDKFGNLYANINPSEIYNALSEKYPGISQVLNRKDVVLPYKVSTIGLFDCVLNFSAAVSVKQKINVKSSDLVSAE